MSKPDKEKARDRREQLKFAAPIIRAIAEVIRAVAVLWDAIR